MSEKCIEHCAVKRDTSYFRPKENQKLEDMPPMPKIEDLQTREEKFTALYIYTAKLVEEKQGADHDPIIIRRQNFESVPSGRVSSVVPIQNLLHASEASVTVFETGKKRKDQGVGSEVVAE